MGTSKRDVRHMEIRSLLMSHGYLTVAQLCEKLSLSEATIRNELRALEEKGMLRRVYGGAMSTANTPYRGGLAMRRPAFHREKQAIARLAAERYLRPEQTVILDTGTTSGELAKVIAELPWHLTVLTNSLQVASIISQSDMHTLYLAGGRYDMAADSFHDMDTASYLSSIHADIFFLCPSGVSADTGYTVPDAGEAGIKKLMMRQAGCTVALADHSKLDRRGFRVVCGPEDVEELVTDWGASEQDLGKLRDGGARMILAEETVEKGNAEKEEAKCKETALAGKKEQIW